MAASRYQQEFEAFKEICLQIMVDEWEDDSWSKTFASVADSAGLCRSTVYRLFSGETKKPYYETIVKICGALDVPQLSSWLAGARRARRKKAA